MGLESTARAAGPWPSRYEAPPVRWTAGFGPQGYSYQTKHYLIISKTELGKGRLAEMTKTAESVIGALASFPLQLVPEDTGGAAPGAGGWRGMHVVRVFDTHESYRANGGPEGSVGVYLPRTGVVAVSLERLIEPKGPRSNLEPRQRYRLLVHELVHQAMGERVRALPMWMIEGFAEYFAACQFAPGRYRFDTDTGAIIDHLRANWIGAGQRAITLPRVSTVQKLNHRTWSADNRTNPEASYAKYAASLFLVHYQLEIARRGGTALPAFLKAEPSFEPVEGVPGRFVEIKPSEEPLWKGRNPLRVERGLNAYWKGRGMDVRFVDGLKRKPYDPFE